MMTKSLTKLFLIILGAIFFIIFIWYRFIRERLPKNIPFHLTEYGCLILMYICCLYFFIIIMLIVTFQIKNSKLNIIVEMIYKPLKVLDESFKENAFITHYHQKFIEAFSKRSINYSKIYYLCNIIPRLPLIITLSLETFYFHHLENVYKIILLGLVIFLYKYFIYSLKYAKEYFTLKLELITDKIMTNYKKNPNDYGSSFLDVREFIDIQTDSIFYKNHRYKINPIPTTSYLALFQGKNVNIKQMQAEHYRLLDIIVPISVHLEEFDLRHNFTSKIKYIKIGIFSTYLICWSYILFVSLPFLPMDAFQWLFIILDIQEPFSLLDVTYKEITPFNE